MKPVIIFFNLLEKEISKHEATMIKVNMNRCKQSYNKYSFLDRIL